MEIENKYFLHFKNYYLSNCQIFKVLKSENKQDYNNDWSSNLFYLIPSKFIKKWKSLISFDNLCKIINKNNKIVDQRTIISLINVNNNLRKIIDDLNKQEFNSIIISSKELNNIITPSFNFDLITKKASESFFSQNNFNNSKLKALIKKGNKKI